MQFFLYLVIISVQQYIQSQKDVEQAQRDYDQAKKEYLQSQEEVNQEIQRLQKEHDNRVKYGCPNPIVSAGGADRMIAVIMFVAQSLHIITGRGTSPIKCLIRGVWLQAMICGATWMNGIVHRMVNDKEWSFDYLKLYS